MNFFRQIQAGVIKEFQVYLNFPRKLVPFVIALLFSWAVFAGKKNTPDWLSRAWECMAIYDILLTCPIFWFFLSEMIHNRQTKMAKFIMMNGMSKAAYITTQFIVYSLLVIPILASQAFTLSLFDLQGQLYNFLGYCFVVNIPTISLALLISRFSMIKQATGSTLIIILGFSFLTFELYGAYARQAQEVFLQLILYVCYIINPHLIVWLGSGSDGSMVGVWKTANIIALIVSGFHLCFYFFFDWLAERQKIQKASRQPENPQVALSFTEADGQTNLLRDELEIPDHTTIIYEEKDFSLNRKSIIGVENISKSFKGMKDLALDNINLQIYEKEIFCLIGHNGAGKTTLLNILTGFLSQTEGSIHYENKEVDSSQIRQSIGFCTQDNIALLENTVIQNLIFMAKIKNVNRDSEIERTIEKLGLNPCKDSLVCNLGQEQRKRLSIAIALLGNPQVIIMDEPTSGLDVITRRVVWQIIKELKEDGKTVIFTTQFLDDTEEIADRLAILSKGKIYALGSVKYVKEQFGTGYTLVISNNKNPAELVTQAGQIDETIKKLIPSAEVISNTTLNILKYALSSFDQKKFSRLFRELEAIPNIQINLQRTNLEEAYRQLERDPNFDNIRAQSLNTGNYTKVQEESFWTKKYTTNFKWQLKMVLLYKNTLASLYKRILLQLVATCVYLIFVNWVQSFSKKFIFELFKVLNEHTVLIYLLWETPAFIKSTSNQDKYNEMFKFMGFKRSNYWLINILIDCVLFLPLCFEVVLVKLIQGKFENDMIFNNLGAEVLAMISLVMMGYTLSRLIPNSSSMVFLFGLPLLWLVSYTILNEITKKMDMYSEWPIVLFFIPNLCFYTAFLAELGSAGSLLSILAILFQFILIVTRDDGDSGKKGISAKIPLDRAELEENPDAFEEKSRLLDTGNKDVVKIVKGYGFYADGWRAVRDLNFGVGKGQIFCLLGPNEAGKSTVFDIITRKAVITSGRAYVQGQKLSKNMKPSYTLGFCLQNDVLWDDFSVEQHFRLYACFKGMPVEETNEAIEYFSEALGLKTYLNKSVKDLSGGTQRKLSVALALIDRPDIIVLDEPTTGVDPVGRSQIWALLKTLAEKRGSTILISTHYMEDAELVADKLGILVNGSLVSVGNIADIRRTYQEHFVVVEGISKGFQETLVLTIKKIIPEALLVDSGLDDKRMIFKISSEAMKFSEVCLHLENYVQDKKIVDFSINVKTLEQALLDFAKQQTKKPNDFQKKSCCSFSLNYAFFLPIFHFILFLYLANIWSFRGQDFR